MASVIKSKGFPTLTDRNRQMTLYRFYRIVGKGVEDSKEYIGSTKQQLHKRLYEHKFSYRTQKKMTSSQKIFELYGIDNCSIILIHELECESKQHALKEERRIYEERLAHIINTNRPSVSPDETSEQRRETAKKHYAVNKEARKKYREENKDKMKEWHQRYRLKNKEKLREQQKARYEARKKLSRLDGESRRSSGSPSS